MLYFKLAHQIYVDDLEKLSCFAHNAELQPLNVSLVAWRFVKTEMSGESLLYSVASAFVKKVMFKRDALLII